MGSSAALGLGDPSLVVTTIFACFLRFPEVAALAGLSVALYGLRPQWLFLGWISLIYGVVLTYFAPERLGAPFWVHFGSPYGLIARMPPFEQFDPGQWFGLLIVAACSAANSCPILLTGRSR